MPQADAFTLFLFARGSLDCTLKVRLYRAILGNSDEPQLNDFVQANFIGYTERPFDNAVPPVWNLSTLHAEIQSGAMAYSVQRDGGPVNAIGGFYVTAHFPDGSEKLVGWRAFENTQHMSELGDTFMFSARVESDGLALTV